MQKIHNKSIDRGSQEGLYEWTALFTKKEERFIRIEGVNLENLRVELGLYLEEQFPKLFRLIDDFSLDYSEKIHSYFMDFTLKNDGNEDTLNLVLYRFHFTKGATTRKVVSKWTRIINSIILRTSKTLSEISCSDTTTDEHLFPVPEDRPQGVM